MRKSKYLKLLIISVLLITCTNLLAQNSNETWDYPIKPGMIEWKKLESHKAMVDVCQVPDKILPTLSTDELVDLCLNYPLFFTMEAFNNLQVGFNQVCAEFNGFQELFRRDAAGRALLNVYHATEPELIEVMKTPLERGLYKQKIFFIEFIFSQKIIIDKLTESDIRWLLSETLVKLDEKAKYKYSSFSTLTTPFIMCRVLEIKKFNKYEILSQKNENYSIFSKAVLLSDKNMMRN